MATKKAKPANTSEISVSEIGANDWRAEADASILIKADEIRSDKARLKAAIKFAQVKQQQMSSVIKENAEELLEGDDMEDDE